MTMETLKQLGEEALIRRLTQDMPLSPGVLMGPGDDCAVVTPLSVTWLELLKTDTILHDFQAIMPLGCRQFRPVIVLSSFNCKISLAISFSNEDATCQTYGLLQCDELLALEVPTPVGDNMRPNIPVWPVRLICSQSSCSWPCQRVLLFT